MPEAARADTTRTRRRVPTEVLAVVRVLQAYLNAYFLWWGFIIACTVSLTVRMRPTTSASTEIYGIRVVEYTCCFIIFVCWALSRRAASFADIRPHRSLLAYGFLSMTFMAPILALGIKHLPMQPKGFAVGLATFWVMPTSLELGSLLSKEKRYMWRHRQLAWVLTMMSNLICTLTVPALLLAFLDDDTLLVNYKPGHLMIRLFLTTMVPLILGTLVRYRVPGAQEYADRHTNALDALCCVCSAVIVWEALSGAREAILRQHCLVFVVVAAVSAVLHTSMLLLSACMLLTVFKAPSSDAWTAAVMSSKKSCVVALAIISYSVDDRSKQGLLSTPCIISEVVQTCVCLVLTRHLKGRGGSSAEHSIDSSSLVGHGDVCGDGPEPINNRWQHDGACREGV